jgi:aerobic carbon-monoxide dehydrogenase large subunit
VLMRSASHEDERNDFVGSPVRRLEDQRLLTGSGCFVDDINPPDCLHVEFLRSRCASGSIRAIDISRALASKGVRAIFGGSDVHHLGTPGVNALVPGLKGVGFSFLPEDAVHTVGQPVLAIVAETISDARNAAELAVVEIEPQVAADDLERNEVFAQSWRAGDIDAAFACAARIVGVRIEHARLAPSPLEPRAAVASWDGAKLTAWLATQTPHRARSDLAAILRLDEGKIRVIAPDVGGAFGGKASIFPEDALVAWCALQTGHPVKWCATRSEDMLAASHGRGAVVEGDLAVAADGTALGLRARLAFPLGHWLTYSAAVPARNAARILPGPYRLPAIAIDTSAHCTRTAAVGIYRGAGRPEAALLMERLMDEAARELGLDPVEVRRRNLIPAKAFPYKTPTVQLLDSGDYEALLERACACAGYRDLLVERQARRGCGGVCGIGVALYVEPCGQGWESASVHIEPDGTIVAATGTSSQGQGRETPFAQIVADVLKLSPGQIVVCHGDTAHTPRGIGALASRSTAIGGSALRKAAEHFRAAADRLASQLATAERPERFASGFTAGPETDWSTIAKLAYCDHATREGLPSGLHSEIVFHADGEAWSSGCCIALVAIDRDTGQPAIERIVWVDDAGTIVNPMLVEGQIVGGFAQGLGEALMERLLYDVDGQLLTGSFMDYALPRACDIPEVELESLQTGSPFNVLGAKGVGEAGCIGAPAAIVNAVIDALSPFGVRHLDMPLTSEKIWRRMRGLTQREDEK